MSSFLAIPNDAFLHAGQGIGWVRLNPKMVYVADEPTNLPESQSAGAFFAPRGGPEILLQPSEFKRVEEAFGYEVVTYDKETEVGRCVFFSDKASLEPYSDATPFVLGSNQALNRRDDLDASDPFAVKAALIADSAKEFCVAAVTQKAPEVLGCVLIAQDGDTYSADRDIADGKVFVGDVLSVPKSYFDGTPSFDLEGFENIVRRSRSASETVDSVWKAVEPASISGLVGKSGQTPESKSSRDVSL